MHIDPNSTRSHIRHGIKTGLAACLSYIIALGFNLNYGYWGALSAVIVMQISVADSMRMCWYRFSGTAVGAVIGIVTILIFPPTVAWTTVGLFVSAGFCAYMTRYNARYRMAAITSTIVVLASLGEEGRILYSLDRVLEIAIGVSCAFVVSVLLWPQRAAAHLQERLRTQFIQGGELYSTILDAFLRQQSGLDPELCTPFIKAVGENRDLLQSVMRHERLIYRDDTRSLMLKVDTLESCARALRTMLESLNDSQGQGYDIIMAPELRNLALTTGAVMSAIGHGQPAYPENLEAALARAEERLGELRDQGATKRFHLHKLMQFFSFFHGMRFLGRDLLRHTRQAPGADGKA